MDCVGSMGLDSYPRHPMFPVDAASAINTLLVYPQRRRDVFDLPVFYGLSKVVSSLFHPSRHISPDFSKLHGPGHIRVDSSIQKQQVMVYVSASFSDGIRRQMKLKSIVRWGWISRAWYYFRIGYSTYLTFFLGYASTLVTLYYLAIKNMPDLLNLFPHFEVFAIVGTVIGLPLAIAIGWVHMKRSSLYASEMDVGIEANPYNYKLAPGVTREAIAPTYLALLRQNRRILASRNLLLPEDEQEIAELERKWQTLISGGYVGQPRRKKWKDAA